MSDNSQSQCFFCGSSSLVRREVEERVSFESVFGLRIEKLILPGLVCETCGAAVIGDEGQELRDQEIVAKRRKAIANDILQIRGDTDMSRDEWLALTRLGDASLSRWENGSHEPTAGYINYLYLLRFQSNVQRLLERQGNIAAAAEESLPENDGESGIWKGALVEAFPDAQFGEDVLEAARHFDPTDFELVAA